MAEKENIVLDVHDTVIGVMPREKLVTARVVYVQEIDEQENETEETENG